MEKVARIIREADIAVGNLESPFVSKTMLKDRANGLKRIFLDAEPCSAIALKYVDFSFLKLRIFILRPDKCFSISVERETQLFCYMSSTFFYKYNNHFHHAQIHKTEKHQQPTEKPLDGQVE
jgi:hypothetical protein